MNRLLKDTGLLDKLIQEKVGPCLSLEIPTQNDPVQKGHNGLLIRTIIKEGTTLLEEMTIPEDVKKDLKYKLLSVYESIDFKYSWHGLGIYVSPAIVTYLNFPFQVTKQVNIGPRFTIRNVLQLKQYMEPYKVMLLTGNKVRLFTAVGESIEEVNNDRFPMVYNEEYEYAKPYAGNSFGYTMKGFEKDKGDMHENRIMAFFREADEALEAYLKDKDQNVILVGTEKILSDFEKSSSGVSVAGEVTGSYNDFNLTQMAEKAWQCMKEYKDANTKELVASLDEQKGHNLIVSGADDVLNVAKEGKGQILFIEKDYRYVKDPLGVYDVTDDAIMTVLEKNGTVVFTDNDELAGYGRIVMKLRY